jgi:hypothetical protein
VNSVIFHCYSAQSFLVLQLSVIHRAIVLSHFSELSHFYCYSAQISHFSMVLNDFVIFSAILLQWTQPFATVLSHFAIMLSNFLLQCSVILWFCQPFSRSCQAFCYSAHSFYDFANHSRDIISHFGTMLIHFAKYLIHSKDSVSHSFEWLPRARGVEGGSWVSWLDRWV